jgi:hypothetical protein
MSRPPARTSPWWQEDPAEDAPDPPDPWGEHDDALVALSEDQRHLLAGTTDEAPSARLTHRASRS